MAVLKQKFAEVEKDGTVDRSIASGERDGLCEEPVDSMLPSCVVTYGYINIPNWIIK